MATLNTGKRIRRFRILRGMTQKSLGIAAGFSRKTADIRIAQYESGARTPKYERICLLAQALDVSPLALTVPRVENDAELLYLLFSLEDEFGIVLCPQPDVFAGTFRESFEVWQLQRERLRAGEISREDYDRWRFGYSVADSFFAGK